MGYSIVEYVSRVQGSILRMSEQDQRREVHLLNLGEPPPMHGVGLAGGTLHFLCRDGATTHDAASLADVSAEDSFTWRGNETSN